MNEPLSAYTISLAASLLFKLGLLYVGYLITKMGYDLLDRGIKGEFKFRANITGLKADLASVSPGLLFAVIGVAMIGFGIFQQNPFASLSVEQGNTAVSKVTIPDPDAPKLPAAPPGN